MQPSHAKRMGFISGTNQCFGKPSPEDSRSAFTTLGEVQILSFIGGQEYTSLSSELLDAPTNMSVAVMTPEKCAMAFRINPHVFENCNLCIVDEFHILNDENRGITLDLCLAQILTQNPETRLLLMSAMVSNGDEVASWLQGLRDGRNVPLIQIPWRPCRTLRSLLFVDREAVKETYDTAIAQLKRLPATRRHVSFNAPLDFLVGCAYAGKQQAIMKTTYQYLCRLSFQVA